MIIEKDKLKAIINEEINRIAENDGPGDKIAELVIEKFDNLEPNQKLNFLEKFFTFLKENNNI
tara:strand:+ start:37 stop:225 length:189 start_codon:yes stop_codon:yes gene_type:complete